MVRGKPGKGVLPTLGQNEPKEETGVTLVIIIGTMVMIGFVGVVMVHVLF